MSQKEDITSLKKRIRELEKENAALQKKSVIASVQGDTVKVPKKIKPLFDKAQETVKEYFSHLKLDPTHGTIEIYDERYVLVRAAALSHDFLKTVQHLYVDQGEKEALAIGKDFLFDIARVIGKNDAIRFHEEMKLTDPIAKLTAGPVHFAYSGWGFVDILPESKPTPDDKFFLVYTHPYSFEADSWIRYGHKSSTPVCVMNAGYSSGWCEESFGVQLTAVEITCRAKGDEHCTFIMAPPHKIQKHIEQYKLKSPLLHNKKLHYDIPNFFERKKMEQQLALYALIVENTDDAIFTLTLDGIITTWNPGAKKLYGYSKKEIVGKSISMLIPPELMQEEDDVMEQIKKDKAVTQFETERLRKNGKRFPISLTVSAIKDSKGHIIGVSKIGHDITKRKEAEKALKELNNSLEILVQERTSDLQRSYDDLETKVTFRNLELEKMNKANLAKIAELEKKLAALTAKKMSYIQLDEVNETYLLGAWKIKKRLVNSNNIDDIFADSSCIKFNKKSFTSTTLDGKKNKGHWKIFREHEVIYNPQVKFQLAKKVKANSIITNLMTDDNETFELILYFDNGLELVLEKDGATTVCK